MDKVNQEVAQEDVNEWLDAKRIPNHKRESNENLIEDLVQNVVNGVLIVSKEKIVHNLMVPLENGEGEVTITQLEYKTRMTVEEYHNSQKGVKTGDVNGMLLGIVSGLTNQNKGVLKKMDTGDWGICSTIATFFL